VVRKLRTKQLDGAVLTIAGLAMIVPGIRVLQLPFLFGSVEEVDYVRDKMWPYFEEEFRAKGFKLQYPGDVGWTRLFSKTPVATMAELRKVKMWVWTDDAIGKAYFDRLQLATVPLGVPDVLAALKTGRIDACYGSPLATLALQWYTEIEFATSMRVAYGTGAAVLRYEVWDQASDADKAAEDANGRKLGERLIARIRKDDGRALAAMKLAGLEVVDTDAETEALFAKEAEVVWKAMAGKIYSKKELAMVLEHRAAFRAKAAAAQPATP
jgi:TRAP-type C4-dicarboxylate transport system substrate-binding protein